jgi:hypothetical protein
MFLNSLTVTELEPDWRLWHLDIPLTFRRANGAEVTVPVGFLSDGASIPRPFWSILPPWGWYSRAAVLHDYLCTMIEARTPHPEATTAHAADAIFLEAMAASGVPVVTRYTMWAAVRLAAIFRIRSSARIAP